MTQPDPQTRAPGPASSPAPAAPSDGSDPASNEAADAGDDAMDYAEALKKIGGEPRPQG